MKKTSNYILLFFKFLVIVIFLALVVGIFIYGNLNPDQEGAKIKTLLDKAPELKTLSREEQQAVVAAIGTAGNIELCKYAEGLNINNLDYYALCKNNVSLREGIEKQSFSACDNVDGTLLSKEDCLNQVLMRSIGSAKNSAICDDAPINIKDNCYYLYWFNQAVLNDDVGLCSSLENIESKNNCQDEFGIHKLFEKKEKFECSDFVSIDLRSSCELFDEVTAEQNSSPSDCDRISHPRFRSQCVDGVRQR